MTVSAPTAASAPTPSKLGLWGVVMVIYFTVAGGAFGIESLVGSSAPGMALILVLLTPFIWSIPTVLMVTELATAMPVEGGYYVWVKRALGRFWGFVQGWTAWLYGMVVAASFAALFTDYSSSFLKLAFGMDLLDVYPVARWLVAAALIAVFAWINIRGAKAVGDSSKVFAAMVFVPFIIMIVMALFRWVQNPVPFWQPLTPPDTGVAGAFGLGLFIVMYNYLGWDGVSTILEEIKNPLKVIPKAMLIAVPLVILGYLLPVVAGLSAGVDYAKWGDTVSFPELASVIGGRWLGIWVALGGMFCAMGLFNAMILSNSRLPFVFAADRYLPARYIERHPRYGTPFRAVILSAGIYALLVVGPFQTLAVTTVLLYGVSLILQFAALIVLRVKAPDMPRPFRVPGGLPGVLLVALLPTFIIILAVRGTVLESGTAFLGLAGALLASAPVAYLMLGAVFKRGQADTLTHEVRPVGHD
ncbi:APC family permease [Deinococcus sp. 12RED42]|uniref:APC family permease n=1 Tax=Deinococcus sp. 12RED42 TaxID=2745872 RepID=UPI001E2ABA6D|nr:APC family permease [Deinococcus sp. 12RED42]MCD0167415.1 APC family permease [Deinococcus sp. 12RED42]